MSDREGGTPLARELASRALKLAATDLPDEVSSAAALHVLDAIGVGLAGATASTTPLTGPLTAPRPGRDHRPGTRRASGAGGSSAGQRDADPFA